MTTPIERAAKAIWNERNKRFPERARRGPDEFDNVSGAWVIVLEDARAALAATRDPTQKMIEAGAKFIDYPSDVWYAMHDAMMEEKETK